MLLLSIYYIQLTENPRAQAPAFMHGVRQVREFIPRQKIVFLLQ